MIRSFCSDQTPEMWEQGELPGVRHLGTAEATLQASLHPFPRCLFAQCWEGRATKNKNNRGREAVLASKHEAMEAVGFFSLKGNGDRCAISWLLEAVPGAEME